MYNYLKCVSVSLKWLQKEKQAVPESTPVFLQYFVSREESQS